MKAFVTIICMLFASLNVRAQSDSARIDSIIHTLPDVMVKGERPIVRVNGAALVYDLQRLIGSKQVDNAYDALKELPGVSEQNGSITLSGLPVSIVIDGKVTTLTAEQLAALLRSIPTSRIDVQCTGAIPAARGGYQYQPAPRERRNTPLTGRNKPCMEPRTPRSFCRTFELNLRFEAVIHGFHVPIQPRIGVLHHRRNGSTLANRRKRL